MAHTLDAGINALASVGTSTEQAQDIVYGIIAFVHAEWPLLVIPLVIFVVALLAESATMAAGNAIGGPVTHGPPED